MKKRYYSGYTLQKDLAFCELVEKIKNDKNIKIKYIADMFEIVEMEYTGFGFSQERKETGRTHAGYDFHYLAIEHNNNYYYIQVADLGFAGLFEITGYKKIDAITKQQATYSEPFDNYEEMIAFLNKQQEYKRVISKTYPQNIYLLELNHMRKSAGNREKYILDNLADIYTIQHDEERSVLQVISKDGRRAEYDTIAEAWTN